MIEKFIDSVLIIDDSKSEIEELEKYFFENDIRINHYTPDELERKTGVFKNRKLLIIDLFLVDGDNLTGNISTIRKYLKDFIGKEFGNYGVVLWTKHLEHLDAFRGKIKLDQEVYTLPLFIIGLDKTKYLTAGNYNGVIDDLEKKISKNTGASFFVNWSNLVQVGKEKATNQIFDLVKDYNKQEDDLKFILKKLAHNYTGIPTSKANDYELEHDAIKAMTDLLHHEITNSFKSKTNLFDDIEKIEFSGIKEDEFKIFGDLNSKLLLDFTNFSQSNVLPGNVYELISDDSNNIISELSYRESKKIKTVKTTEVFENVKNIIIEVTPPCDFSQDKKSNRSRFISGIMFDHSKGFKKYFSDQSFYKELYPIKYDNEEALKVIIFDFKFFNSINEAELKNEAKFKILFRAKDKLFADILQKLSSHTARLGLSVIR